MAATVSPIVTSRGAAVAVNHGASAVAVNHGFVARGARPLSNKLWDHSMHRLLPRKVLAVTALKVQHSELEFCSCNSDEANMRRPNTDGSSC